MKTNSLHKKIGCFSAQKEWKKKKIKKRNSTQKKDEKKVLFQCGETIYEFLINKRGIRYRKASGLWSVEFVSCDTHYLLKYLPTTTTHADWHSYCFIFFFLQIKIKGKKSKSFLLIDNIFHEISSSRRAKDEKEKKRWKLWKFMLNKLKGYVILYSNTQHTQKKSIKYYTIQEVNRHKKKLRKENRKKRKQIFFL